MFQGFRFSALFASLCVFLAFLAAPAAATSIESPPAIQLEKSYDFGADEGATSIATSENGFIINGIANTVENPLAYERLDLQVDWQGEVTSSQRSTLATYEGFYENINLPLVKLDLDDGSTIVMGLTDDGLYHVALAKYFEDGERDWYQDYDPGGWGRPQSCQLLADGGFLVLGTVDGIGGDINYKEDVMLLRTDSVGNQIWLQTYGSPGPSAEIGTIAVPTPDGFIVIASSQTVGQPGDVVAMVINQDGTLSHTNSIGGETEVPEAPLAATVTGSGTIVVAGQAGYYYKDGYQDISPFLVEVAADGSVVWYQSYGDQDEDTITRVFPHALIRTSDGGSLVAGHVEVHGNNSSQAYFAKYDRLGNPVWYQTLTNIPTPQLYSIVPTPQGGYAAIGGVAYDGPTYDIFLVVLGPDGKLFVRGDSNGDGQLDISDPIRTLNYLFAGGVNVACMDAADANDDGGVDISDAVFCLNFLFAGGKDIPPPISKSGMDPTEDALSCGFYYSSS